MSQRDLPSTKNGLFPDSWVVGSDAAKLAREDDNVLIDSIAEQAEENGFDAEAMRAVWRDLAGDDASAGVSTSEPEPEPGPESASEPGPEPAPEPASEPASEPAPVAQPVETRRPQPPSEEELAALHREMDRLRQQVRSNGNSLRRLDRRVTEIGAELTALRDAPEVPATTGEVVPSARVGQRRNRGRIAVAIVGAALLLAVAAWFVLAGRGADAGSAGQGIGMLGAIRQRFGGVEPAAGTVRAPDHAPGGESPSPPADPPADGGGAVPAVPPQPAT